MLNNMLNVLDMLNNKSILYVTSTKNFLGTEKKC